MRRCLYLTYYFPPSGGSGVQRALKMSRYLPDFGWEPTVVSVDPTSAAYPSRDDTLLAEVPEALRVMRTKAWDPYAAYGRLLGEKKDAVVSIGFSGEGRPGIRQNIARFFRANFFIPDARVGWLPFARAELARLAATGEYSAIVSSGPPHSAHLAARRVAGKYGLPWVVDMRDPWTEIHFYNSLPVLPIARAIDKRMERRVLRDADTIVVVSDAMKARLVERGVETPIYCIPNGFDPQDFTSDAPDVSPWTIRHVGSLGPTQSVHALATALGGMSDDDSPFEVSFVGTTDAFATESLTNSDFAGRICVEGVVPHDVAIERMRSAGMLLVVIPEAEGAAAIVTGKLFEYIATGRPVLGIGPADGDAARIMESTGVGKMFDWDDAAGVRQYLEAYAATVRKGAASQEPEAGRRQRYSRREQARALADVLNRLAPAEVPS